MMFMQESNQVHRATEDMYALANATGITFNNVNNSTTTSFNNVNSSTTSRPMSSSPRSIRVSPAPTKTSDLPDDSDFIYPGQVINSSNNDELPLNNVSSPLVSAQVVKPSAIVRPATTDSNTRPVSEAELVEKFELDDATMAQFKEAFRVFDRNDDGRISAQELGVVMKSLGHVPTEHELMDMVSEFDEDGNGTIEFDEFVQMMSRRLRAHSRDDNDLSDAFHVFDRDQDGYITAQELRMVMASLGESLTDEELNAMISAADTDGDGRVNYEEFQSMWQNSGN